MQCYFLLNYNNMDIEKLTDVEIPAEYLNVECDRKWAEVYNDLISSGLSHQAADKGAWLGVMGMLMGVIDHLVAERKMQVRKL